MPVSITIDAKQALGRMTALPEQVRNNLRRVLPQLGKDLGAAVEKNLDRLKSHNRLKVSKKMVENPRTIYVTVSLDWTGEASKKLVPLFLEEGTRPHVIEARNAPVLAFFWEKKGEWFFGPKVNHPGNKAYKIVFDAYELQKVHIRAEMERAVRSAGAVR